MRITVIASINPIYFLLITARGIRNSNNRSQHQAKTPDKFRTHKVLQSTVENILTTIL